MAKNYLWNMSAVNGDISEAISHIQGGDYFNSGLDIGKAIDLLT